MIADAGGAPIKSSPRATCVAHAWLREILYRELEAEAVRRREHVDQLAGKILTAAIVLGLVDTLLADAEKLLAR
jgi:hypothetical protein